MRSLYLKEARASGVYLCVACGSRIAVGDRYFRHDPLWDSIRGRKSSHWCKKCILASDGYIRDQATGNVRTHAVRVVSRLRSDSEPSISGQLRFQLDSKSPVLQPLRVALIPFPAKFLASLASNSYLLSDLAPDQFEDLICDRLYAMGMEPKRVGKVNQRDGGVDIVFWPRSHNTFPFLGAAQVKHHQSTSIQEGPSTVRDFAGVMAGHPFNAGLIVTNTSFSPDAHWFAKKRSHLIRLRELEDLRRWLVGQFGDEEWREIPSEIELCPSVVVQIGPPRIRDS